MVTTTAPVSEKVALLKLKEDREEARAVLSRQPKAIENFGRRQELARRTPEAG